MRTVTLVALAVSTFAVFADASKPIKRKCRVSVRESYSSSYKTYKKCGWWNRRRCTHYANRTLYRTAYRWACCKGYANYPACTGPCKVSVKQSYSGSYTAYKRCGWWLTKRCAYTKYRVLYRTVYKSC